MVIFLPFLQRLVCIGRHIIENIRDIAVKDAAKVVDGGSVHGFIFAEFVDGGAGNMMVIDQCVSCLFRIF